MEHANKRNEALRIESALLNKIALLGTEKTAVLEWGVVDDEMAHLARQVASILKNEKPQPSGNSIRA